MIELFLCFVVVVEDTAIAAEARINGTWSIGFNVVGVRAVFQADGLEGVEKEVDDDDDEVAAVLWCFGNSERGEATWSFGVGSISTLAGTYGPSL
jgi:hypothetical protein